MRHNHRVCAPDDDEQGTPQLSLYLVDNCQAVDDAEGGWCTESSCQILD
jgi:hypothetical protein